VVAPNNLNTELARDVLLDLLSNCENYREYPIEFLVLLTNALSVSFNNESIRIIRNKSLSDFVNVSVGYMTYKRRDKK